ncbi:MAG TPA: hypothetical protein VMF61_09380 [Candidatus Acidoferrales bacterium]|nr:hypothetical protein [Candidatus Acidoferrales bacterium]
MNRRWAALAAAIVTALSGAAARADSGERTIPTAGARVLELQAGDTGVTLLADAPPGAIAVDGGASSQIASSPAGNRLIVTISGSGTSSTVPFAAGAATGLTIHFPEAMRLDVRISGGNVRVVDPASAVEIFDADGDVAVEGPRGAVTAESARGNVTVSSALSSVDVAADAGDVSAELVPGWVGAEVRMQSATGNVRVALPPGFVGRFDVTSADGGTHDSFHAAKARTPFVWLYAPRGQIWIAPAR